MSDLISRADAIKAVNKEIYHSQTDRKTVVAVLSSLPSAEAVSRKAKCCPIAETCMSIDCPVSSEYIGRPSAEAVQGEWIGYNADKEDWLRTDGTPIFLVCDKCHGTVINNGSAHWNFCPNCGAKMKGGVE